MEGLRLFILFFSFWQFRLLYLNFHSPKSIPHCFCSGNVLLEGCWGYKQQVTRKTFSLFQLHQLLVLHRKQIWRKCKDEEYMTNNKKKNNYSILVKQVHVEKKKYLYFIDKWNKQKRLLTITIALTKYTTWWNFFLTTTAIFITHAMFTCTL